MRRGFWRTMSLERNAYRVWMWSALLRNSKQKRWKRYIAYRRGFEEQCLLKEMLPEFECEVIFFRNQSKKGRSRRKIYTLIRPLQSRSIQNFWAASWQWGLIMFLIFTKSVKYRYDRWQMMKHPEFLNCFLTNWALNGFNCNKRYEIQIWHMNWLCRYDIWIYCD